MSEASNSAEAHQQLEAIIERLPNIVYIKDRHGRYLLMNSAGEHLFDRPREAIIGQRDEDLFDTEAAEEIRAIDRRVIETDTPATYESWRPVHGEKRLFRNEKYPYCSVDESVHGVLGISTDVTEERHRQRALEQLHEATRQMQTATKKPDIGEIASATAAQVLHFPTNTVHLYDEDADALVPVAWSDPEGLVEGAAPPQFDAGDGIAWQVFSSGVSRSYADVTATETVYNPETPIRSELLLPLGDHGVMQIGSTKVDDFDDSDEALAQVLAANVEAAFDQVEREQELHRQNDRLADFASVISHDIRNPLNIAQVRTQLLNEEIESEHLDHLYDAHERIDTIIDDVMIWAREGQAIEATAWVSVDRVATACWEAVATDDASLVVVADVEINADEDRLHRVFENLFRNAIEHGGHDVTVTVGPLDDDAGIYVADTGPGIPEADRDTVFETGVSTSDTGTGFGLAICAQIADAHGWTLSATDSDTGGARFEFTGADIRTT